MLRPQSKQSSFHSENVPSSYDVTYTDMPAVITEASFASCLADCALFNNGGTGSTGGILDGIFGVFWID